MCHLKIILYVPEIHPVTGVGFCEREDDGHVFKVFLLLCLRASHVILLQRIGQSLRQVGPFNIQLERFEEAVHDTSSSLTYLALSGPALGSKVCKMLKACLVRVLYTGWRRRAIW